MSQLIKMRQRIDAITTIKKITHATRLIAMSSHTRLANAEPAMTHYKDEIRRLFGRLANDDQRIDHQENLITAQCSPDAPGSLIILIGSQKGFCGNFNISLFKFFEYQFPKITSHDTVFALGKKTHDYLRKRSIATTEQFSRFNNKTMSTIADLLVSHISTEASKYKQVIIISNESRSFFHQRPVKNVLLPMAPLAKTEENLDAYIWPESKDALLHDVSRLYIQASIEALLFSSLVAEQAARFHSMDNATRNAKELLETMFRDYNKLRQSKITKELLELAGNFQR